VSGSGNSLGDSLRNISGGGTGRRCGESGGVGHSDVAANVFILTAGELVAGS
jgi:hypothetical protein